MLIYVLKSYCHSKVWYLYLKLGFYVSAYCDFYYSLLLHSRSTCGKLCYLAVNINQYSVLNYKLG
jgi:hypothetical protein